MFEIFFALILPLLVFISGFLVGISDKTPKNKMSFTENKTTSEPKITNNIEALQAEYKNKRKEYDNACLDFLNTEREFDEIKNKFPILDDDIVNLENIKNAEQQPYQTKYRKTYGGYRNHKK